MKNTLLKKVFISTSLALAISACSEEDGNQAFYNQDAESVTLDVVNGSTDLIKELGEDTTVQYLDLLEGASTPPSTTMNARDWDFQQYEEDEAGKPIWFNEPGLVGYKHLFEGPKLPTGAILKVNNSMEFDFSVFEDDLVHPHTAAIRDAEIAAIELHNSLPENAENQLPVPEQLFHQAVYHFDYLIDNGSKEHTARRTTVIVNGEEDYAEEIQLKQKTFDENGNEIPYSVPYVYEIPLEAVLLPTNATYKEISWSTDSELLNLRVDDENPYKVWLVGAGIGTGSAKVTAMSSDMTGGEQVVGEIAIAVIEIPTEPLSVQFKIDGNIVPLNSTLEVGKGEQLQIEGIKVPEPIDFPQALVWSSSDESIATVDQTGLLSILTDSGTTTITAIVEGTDTQFSVDINAIPHPNLVFESDWDMELGDAAQFWNAGQASNVSESQTYANSGMYSLEINSAGTIISEPLSRVTTITEGMWLKVTFNSLKSVSWNHGGPIRLITPGGEDMWPKDNNWHKTTGPAGQWISQTYYFDVHNQLYRAGWDENSPIQLSLNLGGGAKSYFDNFIISYSSEEEYNNNK